MKECILKAIESICCDIKRSSNAEDNCKRADAVLRLTASGLLLPDGEKAPEAADKPEPTAESCNIPKAGEHFTYRGMEFVVLGVEQGGVLAIVAEPFKDEMPLDKNNCNDWRKSTLRRYLNKEYIKNFDKADLLPFVSDLTSDSGQKDYGTSVDYIALLSCDLYRKYREYVPKYDSWVWTLTPWHISQSLASCTRVVEADGGLTSTNACDDNEVAPVCLFDPSSFEDTLMTRRWNK